MKVVDYENWAWFLFEHEGRLYLDANCNLSSFGYTYMIELNDEELALYARKGRAYLATLAHDIHYSVPIAKDTTSKYKGRDVSNQLSDLATDAVTTWRASANSQ